MSGVTSSLEMSFYKIFIFGAAWEDMIPLRVSLFDCSPACDLIFLAGRVLTACGRYVRFQALVRYLGGIAVEAVLRCIRKEKPRVTAPISCYIFFFGSGNCYLNY